MPLPDQTPLPCYESVSRETQAKLDQYLALLEKWQPKINLVSASTLKEAKTRHFEDSLQLLEYIPAHAKVLYDMGSGAGFPGLVLGIARPDLETHLIEVDQRKGVFLQTVSRETGSRIKVHTSRIEAIELPPPDVVTARALAELKELIRLTQDWWMKNPECTLIFPKGENAQAEIERAEEVYKFELKQYPSRTVRTASVLVLSQMKQK